MKLINVYSPENVERARYAQIGMAVVTAVICLYLVISAALGIQRVQRTEGSLREAVSQSRMLSCTAAALQRKAASQSTQSRGGVDAFALQLSRWARESRVEIESLTPEGAPAQMEVSLGETNLGKWNVYKVRVNGRGDFVSVMNMLKKLREPRIPVRLESVLVQGADAGISGVVSYNILCTVYEKRKVESS